MKIYQDKIIIITGAASGIGRELAERLGAYGARLVLADINQEGLEKVAQQIQAKGGKAEANYLDVRDREAIRELIENQTTQYGRLDYIFNNAGIGMGGETFAMTMEDWQRILDINLLSVIQGTHSAYQIMVRQGHGHIVNTASMLGLIPGPLSTAYATTKHAVYGLSRSLRLEGKAFGVKVTAICPGYVDTNILNATEMFELNQEEAMKIMPYKLFDLKKAVQIILKGVAKNKDVIVFPGHARSAWWLARYFRSFLHQYNVSLLKKLRQQTKIHERIPKEKQVSNEALKK